jgi:hypothetical protein
MDSVAKAGLIFMTFRELSLTRKVELAMRVHTCAFAELLLPAWESKPRLLIKNICVNSVYPVHLHQWRFSNLRVLPA